MAWPKGRETMAPPTCARCKSRRIESTGRACRVAVSITPRQTGPKRYVMADGVWAWCGDCNYLYKSGHKALTGRK